MKPLVGKGEEKERHKERHDAPGGNRHQTPQKGDNNASTDIPEDSPEVALIQWTGSNNRSHDGADCRPDDRHYNSIAERAQGDAQEGITAPKLPGGSQEGSAKAADQCP